MKHWVQKTFLSAFIVSTSFTVSFAAIGILYMSFIAYTVMIGEIEFATVMHKFVALGVSTLIVGIIEYLTIVRPVLKMLKGKGE